MKRRRKNQKREKLIMLGSSMFVLTALTMTGIYVNEKTKEPDDGYVVDLSQLEINDTEELVKDTVEPEMQEDSQTVSSGKIENRDNLEENSYDLPWDNKYDFMEEATEDDFIEEDVFNFFDKEEELTFSEEEQLLWPVVGNVLINYSMDKPVYFATLEQYKYHPAIVIQAKEGQNIMAAAKGRVSKIEKTEELGNVITMDIGSGYEISYGQLGNIQIKEGDLVEKGIYIADVAAPTKYYSVEGVNIYFSLKKDGTPVNPMTKLQ